MCKHILTFFDQTWNMIYIYSVHCIYIYRTSTMYNVDNIVYTCIYMMTLEMERNKKERHLRQ